MGEMEMVRVKGRAERMEDTKCWVNGLWFDYEIQCRSCAEPYIVSIGLGFFVELVGYLIDIQAGVLSSLSATSL